MKITIKRNPKGRSTNDKLKKLIEYFISQQVGDKADLSKLSIEVKFPRLGRGVGGSAVLFPWNFGHYEIKLNKYLSWKELYRVLAHECTHIKQYYTKELVYDYKISKQGRRQSIKIWRGRPYVRKAYIKRPWEVDARKGEAMARGVEAKLFSDKPKAVAEPKPEVKVVSPYTLIQHKAISLLQEDRKADGFIKELIGDNPDRQFKIRVHKEFFELKQKGIVKENIVEGIIWYTLTSGK